MKLNDLEKETALWKKIEATVTERIQILREKNDGDLDERKTAEIRGSIRFAKEVLGWATPNPQFNGD